MTGIIVVIIVVFIVTQTVKTVAVAMRQPKPRFQIWKRKVEWRCLKESAQQQEQKQKQLENVSNGGFTMTAGGL
jgi:hypothetical protein